MEQSVAVQSFSQEQQVYPQKTQHNGTVGNIGAQFQEDASQSWYPRRRTGWSRTYMPNGSSGSENVPQDRFQGRVCYDFLQGKCSRGVSCRFRHPEYDKHDGSGYHGNEKVGEFSKPGTSQLGAVVDNGFRTRSFSRQYRRRSPCRKFQRGRCDRGATCPYLHSENCTPVRPRYVGSAQPQHGITTSNPDFGEANRVNTTRRIDGDKEANANIDPSTRSFYGERRCRSPCRNFLRGRCFREASCPYLHLEDTTHVRPRYDRCTQLHQGVAAASENTNLHERTIDVTLRMSEEHDKANNDSGLRTRSFTGEPRSRSPCRKFQMGRCYHGASCKYLHPLTDERQRYDWTTQQHQRPAETSRNPVAGEQSIDVHQRSRAPGDLGRLEVCLQFSRGRCKYGESCRYLHSFHEYASSIGEQSKQPHLGGTSRNFHGAHQSAPSIMSQGHDYVKNGNTWLNDRTHAGKSFISRDDSFDNKSINQSVGDTVKANNFSQTNETVDGQKCESSGGPIARYHKFAAIDRDTYLRSQPLKRQRSRSRSPFMAKDDFDSRTMRRDGPQNDFHRDRCHNVASFHYPSCRSYVYKRPRYHVNSYSHSKFDSTPKDSCTDEIEKDSNLMETHRHEILSQRVQLHSEAGPAANEEQPTHVEEDSKDLKIAAASGNSGSHEVMMGHGIQLLLHAVGSLDLNSAILNQKSEDQPANDDVECYHVEQDGKGLVIDNTDDDISKGENATELSNSVSSHATDHASPVDTDMSDLDMDSNAEVNINLSLETSEEPEETQQGLKTYSRKRRRRCSKRFLEPLKEKKPDPLVQGPSNSKAGETSPSHADIKSVAVASEDVEKSATKNNSVQNVIMAGLTVEKLEQGNGVMTARIQNDAELVRAVTEDETMHVGDSNCNSMQTADSLKAAISNSGKKLLILDLNGILADIVPDPPARYKPHTMVSRKAVFKRPFCDDFLEFCFEQFNVGVWSSRTRNNVTKVVDFLMRKTKDRLLFCWDQSHCTKTGFNTMENKDKPLVLKELKKLWEKQVANLPWDKGFYNETNTVLLDDSPYKALRNPPYTAVFPRAYTYKDVKDKSIGPGGDLRKYLERLAAADNVQKFIQENPFGQRPITKSNLSWAFYSKIVGNYGSQLEGNAKKPPAPS